MPEPPFECVCVLVLDATVSQVMWLHGRDQNGVKSQVQNLENRYPLFDGSACIKEHCIFKIQFYFPLRYVLIVDLSIMNIIHSCTYLFKILSEHLSLMCQSWAKLWY